MNMRIKRLFTIGAATMTLAVPSAHAQLFINPPDFSGAPVNGSEPGITQPLPGASAEDMRAALLWNLRASLNVAALQCQFSPTLGTVRNYNQLLRHQSRELTNAYARLESYFRRMHGAKGPRVFDQFNTRTYNSFSTLYGQLGFCQTAANVGREALGTPKGELHQLASLRLREIRNSLAPASDRLFGISYTPLPVNTLSNPCMTKRGKPIKNCSY